MEFIPDTKPTVAKHIRNLKKLADYLAIHVPPPHFDMDEFVVHVDKDILDLYGEYDNDPHFIAINGNYLRPYEINKSIYSCGTVACAIGHGPLAGIGKRKLKDYNTWWDYSFHEFGACSFYGNFNTNSVKPTHTTHMAYAWLFDCSWSKVDNTPQGAAKRIYIYLENGVPDNFHEQRDGTEPLMYVDKIEVEHTTVDTSQ